MVARQAHTLKVIGSSPISATMNIEEPYEILRFLLLLVRGKIVMKVLLYSTGCSKCSVLEKKLKNANIDFEISDDVKIPMKQGFFSAPILDVDGKMMDFSAAINWINSLE